MTRWTMFWIGLTALSCSGTNTPASASSNGEPGQGASGTDENSPTAGSASTEKESADGELPPPSAEDSGRTRGAIAFRLEGSECPIGGQLWSFPRDPGTPVSSTDTGTMAEDLERDDEGLGWQVACEWLSTTEPFFLSLAMSQSSQDVGNVRGGPSISMSPFLSAQGTSGGRMLFSVTDEDELYAVEQSPDCEATVLQADVDAGTVWGSFTCPKVTSRNSPESAFCVLEAGHFYFENCRQPE